MSHHEEHEEKRALLKLIWLNILEMSRDRVTRVYNPGINWM
jgi:hypothetical protein